MLLSMVDSEMTRLFRPNNFIAVAGQPANANAAAGQSGGVRRQSLRYQTEQHFGNWKTRSRKRYEPQISANLIGNGKFS